MKSIQCHVLMRDEKEGRKKQARSNKQTRQSNTAHPRQSHVHADSESVPRRIQKEQKTNKRKLNKVDIHVHLLAPSLCITISMLLIKCMSAVCTCTCECT